MKKLKYGSKVKYKGKTYFITDVGSRRVIGAEMINFKHEPFGQVTGVKKSIPIKELRL